MKRIVGFCVAGALGALVVSGCAKENVVKKDEGIAPAATAQPKQADAKSVKKSSGVTKASVTPATDKAGNGSAKAVSQAGEQLTTELEKIYFDFDSFTLSDTARKALTEDAGYLRKSSAATVRIEGNCDERGSAEYNIALGQKRAEAARKYLVTMGIPADRLTTISYGKEKPADQGHDEAAWAKNRRDDFTVLAK